MRGTDRRTAAQEGLGGRYSVVNRLLVDAT